MISINIHEAKTNLSSILVKVEEKGEIVQICRNGKPIAEIRPLQKKKNPLQFKPELKVNFFEDPTTPLDPEDWGDLI